MLGLLFLVSASGASAKVEVVISNSKDWKDVYSILQYGFLEGRNPKFMVTEAHSTLLLNEVSKVSSHVEVISSRKNPFVLGFGEYLQDEGFDGEESVMDNVNLELAPRLANVTNFIIVDDTYGYNAIAVAPYAVSSRSFVLFADRNSIADVVTFLETRQVGKILVYGHVDREVRERLAAYAPEVINKDGDRFANNVEIVRKYSALGNSVKQVILTNGEFIEGELLSGEQATLFIGKGAVPDKINEYIQEAGIEVGVLIGNDLIGTAQTIRRQTGMSVFIKFARGARNPTGPISQVEGLDLFYLPQYILDLVLEDIRYNRITSQIEVTLRNRAPLATYFRGTYTIKATGESQTIGDVSPVFIDGDDVKTLIYPVDTITSSQIAADFFIVFGESKNSLERALRGEMNVTIVEVADLSRLAIEKVLYDGKRKEFLIYLRNFAEVDTFADSEITDLKILDESRDYGSDEVIQIPPGKVGISRVKVDMAEEDFEANPEVYVRVHYGQRRDALVNVVEGKFKWGFKGLDIVTYVPIALIILLMVLILLTATKKKCGECGHKNHRLSRKCRKCRKAL